MVSHPSILSPPRLDRVKAASMAASQAEKDFDGLAALAREFLDVPMTLVTLVDADRQCFIGQAGFGSAWARTRVTPLKDSLCQHVVISERPLVIPDTASDVRTRDNLSIQQLEIVSYLGVPLVSRDGHVLGSFCAMDSKPRHWSRREIALLQSLSEFAERIIEGHVKEMELRRNREGMIRLERMESLGRLAAGVVHDLNNVLASAGLHAELAEMAQPGDLKQHLDAVTHAVHAGARLTNGLLRFSRSAPESEKVIKAAPALHEISTMLKALSTHRIRVQTDFTAVSGYIPMDRGRLEQLMMNLYSNAMDAMPSGGSIGMSGRIRWQPEHVGRWGFEIDEGDYLEISISDTGEGIPDDVAETLFEPFVTSKPLGRGTGLGLAAVYGFVRSAGGSIDFVTGPDGTTFTVLLPLRGEAGPEPVAEPESPTPTADAPISILIVDDEPSIRMVLKRVVERRGLAVHAAATVEEALKTASTGPLLLITDIRLRDGNGVDLARQITQLNPDCRVVFMSGAIEHDRLSVIPARQRAGVIQKPFSLSDVEAVLQHSCAS